MLTNELLFDAIGEIDDSFILDVAEILEQSGGKVVRAQNKTVWRVLLVAAILISLFTATAYALGWFGLSARRMTPDLPEVTSSALSDADAETMARIRDTHRHSYVSLGGVTGSPEYSAAAEWLSWRANHEEEMAATQLEKGETYYAWRDLERSFTESDEELSVARLYGCWDRASLDKLYQIAEAHGLKLHTQRTKLWDNRIFSDLCTYENGSSKREGAAEVDGKMTFYLVYTELPGYLPAEELTTSLTDEYTEWEYTTANGETVNIAILEGMRNPHSVPASTDVSVFIFWQGEQGNVTVVFHHPGVMDKLEEWQSHVERIADTIDFASYVKGAQP